MRRGRRWMAVARFLGSPDLLANPKTIKCTPQGTHEPGAPNDATRPTPGDSAGSPLLTRFGPNHQDLLRSKSLRLGDKCVPQGLGFRVLGFRVQAEDARRCAAAGAGQCRRDPVAHLIWLQIPKPNQMPQGAHEPGAPSDATKPAPGDFAGSPLLTCYGPDL